MKKLFLLLSVLFLFSCSQETIKYTLTTSVNPADAGTVNPETRQYNEGDTANLIASPAAEYIFDKWTGATGTEETTIVMNSDKTVVANFIKKKYALTTAVEGEGTVTEKIIKSGAATDYNSGTVVELTATPSAGWKFKEWSGDLTGTENPKEITIDKPKTVKAVFEEQLPFYLDANGVTIKARDWVTAGTTGELGGVTYTAVDRDMLIKMLTDEADVSKVVTTLVTSLDGRSVTSGYGGFFNVAKVNISGPTADVFSDDISSWDVSNVTNMFETFNATNFSADISNWDVSKVTNMENMFKSSPFSSSTDEYKLDQDISKWDVSNVTNMKNMFTNRTFNQDISSWDTSKVTDMMSMFSGASAFNQDISKWDVSKVTDMSSMFNGATSFNQDISKWDVSKATDMSSMFNGATSFNQNISGWSFAIGANLSSMFSNATSFNGDVSGLSFKGANLSFMFNGATSFKGDVTGWSFSEGVNLSYIFNGNTSFNQDISGWNISGVTGLSGLFNGNTSFNQDISGWDTSNVSGMNSMFQNTTFNGDISSWDISKVVSIEDMFSGNTSFNQDISGWNTSNVISMSGVFQGATAFNQDISSWDTSKVTDMISMFNGASTFNQDIGNWNTSNVKRNTEYGGWPSGMIAMFKNASSFNQDLSKWCVTKMGIKPYQFNEGSALTDANLPIWGTCPSSGSNIWTGATQSFTKSDGSDPNLEANQDRLTSNVWITRGTDGGQIYNVAKESTANKTNSPVGTTWAIGTIDERESLTFKKFRAAVGKPKDVVGKDLVMYLEDDDIYLSVKFSDWSQKKNGGFTYERSSK